MIAYMCVVDDCTHNKDGRCAVVRRGHAPCAYGAFVNAVDAHLKSYGHYKLREYVTGPIVARLRGTRGTVEVWGGAHAHEVWFVERGTKREECVTRDWYVRGTARDGSMPLADAVARACSLAGVQSSMALA